MVLGLLGEANNQNMLKVKNDIDKSQKKMTYKYNNLFVTILIKMI
jgi:hypothetical protein